MQRFLSILVISAFVLNCLWTNTAHAFQPGQVLKAYYNPVAYKLFEKEKSKTQEWKGFFAAKKFAPTQEDQRKLLNVQQLLKKAMANLSFKHLEELHTLEVYKESEDETRGKAGSHRMILNLNHIQSNNELTGVFTHEAGHIVDLGFLKGTSELRSGFVDRKNYVPADDPSTDFYRISWKNSNVKRTESQRNDFVSGYAMSNPFEDFAETFLFYRYHGDKFRALAEKSPALRKKYKFMQDTVFYGEEFQSGKDYTFQNNIWDVTLLSIES